MTEADWSTRIELGRSGLEVSRLGIGSSYGAPARAIYKAFDAGVNYLYWGTYRREPFAEAVRQLAGSHRDEMVVVLQSYSRVGWLIKQSVRFGLRRLGLDHADVLLLGLYNTPPPERVMEAALGLEQAGLVRCVAVSCHHRPTFQKYIRDERIDIIHARYNAAHPGAEREVFPHLPAEGGPGVVVYTATRWGQLCDPARMPPGEPTPRGSDCYRFVLSRPEVHVCMTGPSDMAQMDEALAALERGPMDDDELAWMQRVGAYIHANQSWLDGQPLMRRHMGVRSAAERQRR